MSLYFNQTTSQQVVSLSLHTKHKLNEDNKPVKETTSRVSIKRNKKMNELT